MKILLVTEFFPTGKNLKFSGGVEARTYFIAKNLAKRHKVTVLAARTKDTSHEEIINGFKVLRVGKERNYTASTGHILSRLYFIRKAIDAGKTLDIDIVDGSNYIAHFIVKNIAKTKKIPAVAWYPDVWLNDWIKNVGLSGIFGEILERFNLLRGFDAYIAISKNTASKLSKFTKNKVHTIYCGVQKNEFRNKTKKFPQKTILSVSRLVKYKNIKTLIFAFAHLYTYAKNINLIIVGAGPELEKLKSQAKNLKIGNNVNFYSNLTREELLKLYKSSHVFSLPSIVEGFGIATIEAAAAGLPYVNSNVSIHKEVTKNGEGAYLVNPQKPIEFSKKLKLLLTDSKLYRKKSAGAKKLSKYYDWDKITKQTEQIYISLLKK